MSMRCSVEGRAIDVITDMKGDLNMKLSIKGLYVEASQEEVEAIFSEKGVCFSAMQGEVADDKKEDIHVHINAMMPPVLDGTITATIGTENDSDKDEKEMSESDTKSECNKSKALDDETPKKNLKTMEAYIVNGRLKVKTANGEYISL